MVLNKAFFFGFFSWRRTRLFFNDIQANVYFFWFCVCQMFLQDF